MQKNMKLLIVLSAVFVMCVSNLEWVGENSVLAQDQVTGKTVKSATDKATKTSEAKVYDQTVNLESFDKVWRTVKDVHWDEDLIEKKWDGLHDEYRLRAEKAESLKEMRGVIQGMLAELGQSHFSLIPEESYEAIESGETGNATSGLTLRIIGDEAVVTKVAEESSAAKAGVIPGWVLKSCNGKEISELVEHVKKAAHGPMRFETLAGVTLDKSLSGQEGEKLELVMTNSHGKTEEFSLELSEPQGTMAKFGNMIPMKVTYESKSLDGNIGYFTFNLFFDPANIMPAFRETVHNEQNSKGLVIDLRGNIGGMGAMTMGMASVLSDKQTKLGTMTMKGSSLDLAVSESPDPVTYPIAVLIDEVSVSSAEVFSGGLQDIGVARLFGSRSAGQALPSTVIKLPNGDGFQYAMASYVSASGKPLEFEGVTPDEQIELSKDLLLLDGDPVLSRAMEWIMSENEKRRFDN